jgi:predicted DNA-binding transcriptional regulator AlpA
MDFFSYEVDMMKKGHQDSQITRPKTDQQPYQVQFPEVLGTPHPGRLLRVRQVLERIPISRSAWWLGVSEGRYPKPIKLGPRTTAWLEQDVDELIARLTTEARGGHED